MVAIGLRSIITVAMDIIKATRDFEKWLGGCLKIVKPDLDYKHEQMRVDPFLYFRATYYRWVQHWLEHLPELARVGETLVVGDLHLENFGTWRDEEGRLIWGVNDFDEAHPMSFANDLVRLAVSAELAARSSETFAINGDEICREILAGYQESLERRGEPFVLMEKHPLLRKMALQDLRQPATFWSHLEEKTAEPTEKIPGPVIKALREITPQEADLARRVIRTPKGLGSLGRQRFLALGEWEGGMIAREAKAVAPSALVWAMGKPPAQGNAWLETTVRCAVRCSDPFYKVHRNWLVRRLAPDCSRIDFNELAKHENRALLLHCMGAETANIHLGAKKARRKIRRDLEKLPKHWLRHATKKMLTLCLADWKKFKKG